MKWTFHGIKKVQSLLCNRKSKQNQILLLWYKFSSLKMIYLIIEFQCYCSVSTKMQYNIT